jgi:CHAT domain-containing protein
MGTEMAVLSACDTGIGVIRAGEGVYGLRRAFAVSGARILVLSLWPVGDAPARLLMTDFYGRIISDDDLPSAEALRQSMLAMKTRDSRPLGGVHLPISWSAGEVRERRTAAALTR